MSNIVGYGRVEIRVGDCRELLRAMPAESVDCVVTDPPYQQTSLEWDRWPDGWPTEVRRVLKPTGSMWVFGSLRMFMERRDDFGGWRMAQDIVWEKHNGSSFHADRFRRVHEQAVQFYRDDAPWGEVYKAKVVTLDATKRTVRRKQRPPHMGQIERGHYTSEDGGPRLMRSVIAVRSMHGAAVHPTQKPLALIERLIEIFTDPDDVVIDPCAGSGVTLLGAKNLWRRAYGFEIKKNFFRDANERILTYSSPYLFCEKAPRREDAQAELIV